MSHIIKDPEKFRLQSHALEGNNNKNNLTEIDSEEISHESILDFEEQEVITESFKQEQENTENGRRSINYYINESCQNETQSVQGESKII